MNESTLKILNAKFPKKQIMKRKLGAGDNERWVDYVTGSIVIRRLNEAFEGEWSFHIIDKVIDMTENQIAVLGRIEVPRWRVEQIQSKSASTSTSKHLETVSECSNSDEGVSSGQEYEYSITKEQWGGSAIERYRSTKMVIDLGNNLKAAATDSLKKCASLLGVGLHLYDTDEVLSTTEPDKEGDEKKSNEPTIPIDTKPASKIQQQAVMKVLAARKVEPETLLTALGLKSIDEINCTVAASLITLKHDFWKGVTQNDKSK